MKRWQRKQNPSGPLTPEHRSFCSVSDGLSNESKQLSLGYSLRMDIGKDMGIHSKCLMTRMLDSLASSPQTLSLWTFIQDAGYLDTLTASVDLLPSLLCFGTNSVLTGLTKMQWQGTKKGGCTGGGRCEGLCFLLLLPEAGSRISLHWPQPSFHFLRTPLPFSTALYSRNLTRETSKMPWALVDFFKCGLILFHFSAFPKILH